MVESGTGAGSRLSSRTWLVIVLVAACGQIAWAVENNFFNLFIQDAFGASLNDIALMVSASALTATASTLVVGAWSDRVGRRKVFVCLGYVIWGFTILAFAELQRVSTVLAGEAAAAASLGVTLTIIFDCIMTFFGSGANDACFNAWVTDITDDTNRGRVEGVNSAMPLLSMLVVFGGAMFLMSTNAAGVVTYDYHTFFLIIGGVVIAVGILSALLMDESYPTPNRDKAFVSSLAQGFKPSMARENRRLYLVLLGYLVFATAMQVFMPYYVLYLRLPNVLSDAYVFVMAPGIVIAALFTIVYGRRVDRVGFSKSVIVPLVLFFVGCVLLTLSPAMPIVFAGSVLMLSGYLSAVACFAAEVRNNTPLDCVGMLQGVRIFAVVLVPMLIGPWIGSLVSASGGAIAGFGVAGDGFTPSSMIFLAGAIVSLVCIPVLACIRKTQQ